MIQNQTFREALSKLVTSLERDLIQRSTSPEIPEVTTALRAEYDEAFQARRTARTFSEWLQGMSTQVASAWCLSCVFLRFLEDTELLEVPKLSGPIPRLHRARDERKIYFDSNPSHDERHYLLSLFEELSQIGATKELFGSHNPLRDHPMWLSGDAARELVEFFQRIDPNTGALLFDFTDPELSTRFLGDLYQNLSEYARKTFALLQTPDFVESFILDRTLEPALDEFGLGKPGFEERIEKLTGRLSPDDRFRMIDPACGSGHFLLSSFERILSRWQLKYPGEKIGVLVQRTLDCVHGVDLNPYAAAIARFRLLVACIKACAVKRLKDLPEFEIHLAVGDSLLHGTSREQFELVEGDRLSHFYQPEDREALEEILHPGRYHAVVANPPYITPKDKALNEAYRERYATCHRKYSLSVPFVERIVSLAVDAGYTGQITANSFMKREFGKKLIESYFPRIDLTHVIDTSGAYIPGHGTPTVILLARNRTPQSAVVRIVMGIRGEPERPEDPRLGQVWKAILSQLDSPGLESPFVSSADASRDVFSKHPWSIGGGGASELKEYLDERGARKFGAAVESIGFMAITGEDDAYAAPASTFRRRRLPFRTFGLGDVVRDWRIASDESIIYMYDADLKPAGEKLEELLLSLWAYRTRLKNRLMFGKYPEEAGLAWYEYRFKSDERLLAPRLITFAFVATHNHFVLDRGGKVFNRSAPVIKLPDGASEDEHLALLGVLNSSTACFWMKQVFYPKGGDQVGGEGARVRKTLWEERYEFAGTGLESFPLPKELPTEFSSKLERMARELTSEDHQALIAGQDRFADLLSQSVSLQEELDWSAYHLYGLTEIDLSFRESTPRLNLGQRAFEIVMARKAAEGELETTWFARHGSHPITDLPSHWPADYRVLVERRIELIESDRNIALIEQPEYKRRWNIEPWQDQVERALRSFLLNRLETYFDFDGRMNEEGAPTAQLDKALTSIARLADLARRDEKFQEAGALYRKDAAFDVERLVHELVEEESVPIQPVLRYKEPGVRKRADWERTWEMQRAEDKIDARTKLAKDRSEYLTEAQAKELKAREVGTIPVPPKYDQKDFQKTHYWRLRGKLDVPKERWVTFGIAGEDGTPIIAWAGYNQLEMARAVSAYLTEVQERLGGREDPRVVPLLVALSELVPWVKQWHNELDPEFDVRPGDYFEDHLQLEAKAIGLTVEDLRNWRPQAPVKTKAERKKASPKSRKEEPPIHEAEVPV